MLARPVLPRFLAGTARSLAGRILQNQSGVPAARPTALFHYLKETGSERSRIHLRFESDSSAALIVNADRLFHLNPTAALMARMILEARPDADIVRAVSARYRTTHTRARADLASFRSQFETLLQPDAPCPIHVLDLETTMPFSARPSAPFRMDLALTYRCNNDCAHCYNARERDFPELATAGWKSILDRLWELGVPHVVFTGGEPTLRLDLPELIAHAEALGQITGLNTNGRRLADHRFVDRLAEAGLDHVQITVESSEEDVHTEMVRSSSAFKQTIQGLQNALGSRLFVMTNTTMLRTNHHGVSDTLDFLADLGVPTIGLNALIYSGRGRSVGTGLRESELQPLLDLARAKTSARGQRLIWYTPTQYCEFDPTEHDLGVKGCTAALYSMCVEPNGDVLPCQSYYQPLGNLLADPWDTIWNHELSIQLRERQLLPQKCGTCSLLPSCGGGCPLQVEQAAAMADALLA
jgi:radical SAM protein with 4Fe4S-binding SPASM domain